MRTAQPTGLTMPALQTTGPLPHPRTYYVSPRGNNLNPGTHALPLRTIQAGINKACAGDLVMVLAGRYKESVTFPRSGSRGSPITVQGEVDRAGNPLAVVDKSESVTADWIAAPEVGSGVYKTALGYTPLAIYVDSLQIVGIDSAMMAGDSSSGHGVWPGTGMHMLGFTTSKVWVHPFEATCSPKWWDAVGAMYGVLGDTTYIRFKDGDDPNSKNLRASSGFGFNVYFNDVDYIKLKQMRVQGSPYVVWGNYANHCVLDSCVIRHGYQRIGFNNGSHNAVRNCDLSLGRYGATFREWSNADGDSIPDSAAYSVVQYCISKWMYGDLACVQLVNETDDEISGCDFHDTHVGVVARPADRTSIHGNQFTRTSAAGIEQQWCITHDSTTIYDNDFTHCAIAYRPSQVGERGDTCRRTYFYNNRSYQDDGLGNHFLVHEVADYDYYIQNGDANSPEIWLYHNSFAGGSYWANPVKYACDSMRMVNNIFSSHYMVADVVAREMTDSSLFAGFDYNFIGGGFRYYGGLAWAAKDVHNQWPADSVHGDVDHQVWPLGSEPDWAVPGTSTAYQSGLDLSDSFTIRGIKYGPLPGMTPGYFPGAKPNLGAVQNTSPLGTPDRDSGLGSVTRLPELTLEPNPTTGTHARIRCAIPAGTVGKLTLHDVLGRTVKSIELEPSGITPQPDLSGFSPGVYIVTLKTTDHSVSRRLVIIGR